MKITARFLILPLIRIYSSLAEALLHRQPSLATRINYFNATTHSNYEAMLGESVNITSKQLDESLYSRQIYVLGKDAMLRLANADVFVSGLSGLGAEICKNIILAGVRSVTVHDNRLTSLNDLSTQFCLKETSVDKNRAIESLTHLKELNPYVDVRIHKGPFPMDDIMSGKYKVVCCVDEVLKTQIALNDACRIGGSKFISTSTWGVFASIFCDFGELFIVTDSDGQEPQSSLVECIECSTDGRVSLVRGERHQFNVGDTVRFEGINIISSNGHISALPEKMANSTFFDDHEFVITNKLGENTVFIGDTSPMGSGCKGFNGRMKKVKKSLHMTFHPLRKAIAPPLLSSLLVPSDFSKCSENRIKTVHACFITLDRFRRQHKGRLPRSGSSRDAKRFLQLVKENPLFCNRNVTEDVVVTFSRTAAGNLAPLSCFYGGIVAQEILKACTGLFVPLHQFMYYDCIEALPQPLPSSKECAPRGDRYDGQRCVIGDSLQHNLFKKRLLLVGAGAIGCELLKNFALMGVGCSHSDTIVKSRNTTGQIEDDQIIDNRGIIVTDMDTIERSNLNRQFLFREKDIGRAKSEAAVESAKVINSELVATALLKRIGPESDSFFDDDFWENLNITVNALDNVEARLYVDTKCVKSNCPLLDSGTLGAKGSTQVIVPGLSESYGSSVDPEEPGIPLCTVKHFPTEISHTIHWARDVFDGLFSIRPQGTNKLLESTGNLDREKEYAKELFEQGDASVSIMLSTLFEDLPEAGMDFARCLNWAKEQFNIFFVRDAEDLFSQHPLDSKDEEGDHFWQGIRRPPKVLKLDSSKPTHREFIWWAAVLRARVYNVPVPQSITEFRAPSNDYSAEEFNRPPNVHKSWQSASEKNSNIDFAEENTCFEEKLDKAFSAAHWWKNHGFPLLNPLTFEKDDDTNGHMDFITAASNLRATAYGIPTNDKLSSKRIAGNIVPAIATTTAAVSGLVCVELIKLAQFIPSKGHIAPSLAPFKNAFIDLAQPFLSFSEPAEAERTPWGRGDDRNRTFNVWDKIVIKGPEHLTLRDLLKNLQENHGAKSASLYYDNMLIYASFLDVNGSSKDLDRKIVDLVQDAMKNEEPEEKHKGAHLTFSKKRIDFGIVAEDEDGEDLALPVIQLIFMDKCKPKRRGSFLKGKFARKSKIRT